MVKEEALNLSISFIATLAKSNSSTYYDQVTGPLVSVI